MSSWEDAPTSGSTDGWEDAEWEDAGTTKKKGFFPEVGRTIDTGVRNIADIATTLPLMVGGGLASLVSQDAGDEIFRRMNTVQEMIHEGESTPETLLGKVGASALPMITGMPLGGAGIAGMMTGGMSRSGQGLVEQGVDPSTATVASGIDVGTNLAGALVPGGVLAQTGANVVAGGLGDLAVQKYLQSRDYGEAAKQYYPLDPVRRGTDLAVGAAFGVRSKLAAKPKDSKLSDPEIEQLRERAEQLRVKEVETTKTQDNASFYEQLSLDLRFKQTPESLQDLINRTEQDIQPAQRDLFTPENLSKGTAKEPVDFTSSTPIGKQQPNILELTTKVRAQIEWAENRPREALAILKDLKDNPDATPHQKVLGTLAEKLLDNPRIGPKTWITASIKDNPEALGYYNNRTGVAGLRASAGNVDMLHEVVHSATNKAILHYRSGEFNKISFKERAAVTSLDSIYKELQKPRNKAILEENLTPEGTKVLLTNLQEIPAYGLTHPRVMEVFKNIKLPSGVTLWSKVMDFISDLFGLSQKERRTVMQEVEKAGSTLIEESSGKEYGLGGTSYSKLKPEISFENFKRSLPEDLLDVADQLYKEKYGVTDLGKVDIATNNDTIKALDKLPGLKGVLPVELVPKEEMFQVWKNEKDIPMNVLRDQLVSGGRMASLMTNNSYVNWLVEKINRNVRDTEVITKKATHDIVSASNKLKTVFGFKDESLVETMRELIAKEGLDEPLNLKSPTQQQLVTSIRTSWDNLYKAVNEERAARGIGPVEYRPNYLTALFKGPYRGLVKDAEGKTVGVVAANTMKEAQLAVSEISRLATEKGIPVTIEQPTFSKVFAKDSFQKNIGAYYVQMNELMNMFGNESPTGKAFQDVATEWYDRRVRDHLGYRQHFKNKKGVIGSEGNKPWRDIRENALDMLDAQVEGLQAGWQWVAQQRTAREIHDVLNSPETQHLKNASEYVTKYYDHAFNREGKGLDPVRGIIDGIAKQTGLNPEPVYEALGITRNFALVSTLGMSGGFVISQLAQVPQALISATTFLREKGVSANTFAAFKEGLHDFYSAKDNNGIHSIEGKYAYDYFSKHGTFDPHLLEKQIPRKLISTSGSSGFRKALLNGLINGPVWAVEQYNKFMGHISIEMAETATRGTFAMSMFHYLRRAGFPKEEAAPMADKLTSDFFVDYNPHERPMMWSSLGEMGKFASTVTTFKMNALNQGATFANAKAYKTFAAATLTLTALAGVAGLPGFDELEDVFSALKRYVNPDIQTPKEILLKEAPDVLTFGALATATDTNLQTKFNQGNVLPDDVSNFLFPLGRVLYNMGESVAGAVSNPNKETLGRMAWEFAPGGAKAVPEFAAFTDKETGMFMNPRAAGKGEYENAGVGVRTEADRVKRTLGLTSLEEAKAKDIQFMMKRDKEITDKRLASSLKKAVQAIMVRDEEAIVENLQKYFEEGGTEEGLKRRLTASAVGRNTDIKSRMLAHIKAGTLRQALEAGNLMEYTNE